MHVVIRLAIGLLIGGLAIAFLSKRSLGAGVFGTVVWWVGAVLVVIGLVLLLAPVWAWLSFQLHSMLGV